MNYSADERREGEQSLSDSPAGWQEPVDDVYASGDEWKGPSDQLFGWAEQTTRRITLRMTGEKKANGTEPTS